MTTLDLASAPLDETSALASSLIDAVEAGSSAALAKSLAALDPDERAAAASVALLPAASSGRSQLVQQLLDAGASPVARGQGGATALMLAASSGSGESVQWLCEAGADPNESDDAGERALDYAARAGADEAKRLLLAWGARASAPKKPSRLAAPPRPPAATAPSLVVQSPSFIDWLWDNPTLLQLLVGAVIAVFIVVGVLLADAVGLIR